MFKAELIDSIRQLKTWYHNQLGPMYPADVSSPAVVSQRLAAKPTITTPTPPKETIHFKTKLPVSGVSEPESINPALAKWAASHFVIKEPITPIVCVGEHPLLKRLCSALTNQIAPAMCMATMPDLKHPLLKLLLIPLDSAKQLPALEPVLPSLIVHHWTPPLFPIYAPERYEHDESLKRLLWQTIQHLPLFC